MGPQVPGFFRRRNGDGSFPLQSSGLFWVQVMINHTDGGALGGTKMPEYFPFSPAKFLEELKGLTGSQVCAYTYMLGLCHHQGSISSDPKDLLVIYGREFPLEDVKVVMARMVPDLDNPERLLHPHYVLWKEDGAPERGEA